MREGAVLAYHHFVDEIVVSIGIILVCAIFVAVLLAAEKRADQRLKWIAKPAASAAFIAMALHLGALSGGLFGHLMLAGLVLCAAGDVFLIPRGEKTFLAGMGAFGLGHAAYAAAFMTQAPAAKPAVLVAVILMAAMCGFVLRIMWKNLGPMRWPVVAYMGIISLMAVVSVAATPPGGYYFPMLIVGAFGFALSDVSVARDQFLKRDFANRLWGLPLYYGSQLLLAASV